MLQHCQEHGAGVLGVEVDLFFFQRLVRNQRAAKVEFFLGLDTGSVECLRVDLRQYKLLGKVFGTDPNRLLGVRGQRNHRGQRQCGQGQKVVNLHADLR